MRIKKIFSIFTIVLINISIIYFFNTRIISIPPLGKFLDPFNGYLHLTNSDNLPKNNILFSRDISKRIQEDSCGMLIFQLKIHRLCSSHNTLLITFLRKKYVFCQTKTFKLSSTN